MIDFLKVKKGLLFLTLREHGFILAKAAGANIRIKKKVVIDLDVIEEYLEKQCLEENGGV